MNVADLLRRVDRGRVRRWSETYEWNNRQIDALVNAGVLQWDGERPEIGMKIKRVWYSDEERYRYYREDGVEVSDEAGSTYCETGPRDAMRDKLMAPSMKLFMDAWDKILEERDAARND